jgi:hypothetical protein
MKKIILILTSFVAVCFLFWFLKGLNEVAVNANVVEENLRDSINESDTIPVPLIVHSPYIPPVAKPNPDFILFEELGSDTITVHQKSLKFKEYEFKAKIKIIKGDKTSYWPSDKYVIEKLECFRNNVLVGTFKKFEEVVDYLEYKFSFGDYNLDGHLDFTIAAYERSGKFMYYDYYIYDPNTHKVHYEKDWEWVKIDSVDLKKKRILTVAEGNYCKFSKDEFKVNNRNLQLIKTHGYNFCDEN